MQSPFGLLKKAAGLPLDDHMNLAFPTVPDVSKLILDKLKDQSPDSCTVLIIGILKTIV